MEAFILHINKTHHEFESKHFNADGKATIIKFDTPKIIINDFYSAWCTEKQAYKEAARILFESCEKYYSYTSLFYGSSLPALLQAVKILINGEFFKEAVKLISEYDFSNTHSKITIKINIIQSTFKGSAFE